MALATLYHGWRTVHRWWLDLFFPPRCVVCRRVDTWLCGRCLPKLPRLPAPTCPHCGQPSPGGRLCHNCRSHPSQIRGIRSLYLFEGVVQDAVHCLKYRQATAIAEPLGRQMAAFWRRQPVRVDVVVPVPLHTRRMQQRGYNQAALLGRVLAAELACQFDEQTLQRVRATPSQTRLNAQERRANVLDAFACAPGALDGQRVLLVDDVCTTGATLEACAAALHAGGSREVWAFTLARAP